MAGNAPEVELHGRLDAAQLAASIEAALASWDGREPLWVFGYASLIWNPDLDFDRRVAARVHGYHRRLCLWSRINRGTPDCPGLVAGLDRGGSCAGIAYRIAPAGTRREFERLWQREMLLASYTPRWLDCHLVDGSRVRALAFVVRRSAPNYAGKLSEAAILEVLTQGACGRYGTSLDYLVNCVTALRENGLSDPHLERIARHAGVDAGHLQRADPPRDKPTMPR